MKIVLIAIALVVLAVLIAVIVKHSTSSDDNLITATSSVQPVNNITIKGNTKEITSVISVNSLGQISFTQTINKTIKDTIDPKKVNPNSSKQLSSPISITTNIVKDYVYTTSGIFYTRTTIKQGSNKPKIIIKAYNLSKGPLAPFQCFSIVDKLKTMGYSDPNIIFTPKVKAAFNIGLKDIIIPKINEYNKANGTNIVITTVDDFINTTWYNVCGLRDRLYQPNKTVNTKFLGLSNLKIYTGAAKISAPLWAKNVRVENTITKDIIQNVDGKEQIISKTVEIPKFQPLDPFKFPFKDMGYNSKTVDNNLTDILLNPLVGIDFNKIEEEINNNPLPETGYTDLANNVNMYNQALAIPANRQAFFEGMFKDPKTYKLINNKDPNYADKEQYYYYPVDTPKSIEEITKLNPAVKRPTILYGMVKMPSQKVREQGEKLSEELRKRYDNCRYQIQKIKQPFNSGNACPDSQDAALSHYVYAPAKSCDMVRIGDIWCSYDTTNFLDPSGGDNMLTCEWGRQNHESTGIQDYQKITFTFEGTEGNICDWLADLVVIPWFSPTLGCFVHLGFWSKFLLWIPKILKGLRAQVVQRDIDGNPSKISTRFKKAILIGHSLGGAIAHLAAAYIQAICVGGIEVEVATQGAPSPFWLSKPLDSFFINYPKRYKGYFYDECIFNPNRDDPVPDVLFMLGFEHWFDFEAPVRRVVERDWDWNLFEGGWTRCYRTGGHFDTEENYISVLRIALDTLGFFTGGIPWGEILDLILGFIFEHTITEYFPKISNTQCPGAWDPTPDVDFDQMGYAGQCSNVGSSDECLNGGVCEDYELPVGGIKFKKCSNYTIV